MDTDKRSLLLLKDDRARQNLNNPLIYRLYCLILDYCYGTLSDSDYFALQRVIRALKASNAKLNS